MKPTESLNRFHDNALSAEERALLEDELKRDPELAEALVQLQALTELHHESMPAPKSADFIEAEWKAIQCQLAPRASEKSPQSVTNRRSATPGHKLLEFPVSPWFRGALAAAAALALTVSGIWIWNHPSSEPSTLLQGQVEFVQTDIDGASSMIFMDEQSGWTFVWIDEPLNGTEAAG